MRVNRHASIFLLMIACSLPSSVLTAQEPRAEQLNQWIDLTGEVIRDTVPEIMSGDMAFLGDVNWERLGMEIYDALHGVSWDEVAGRLPEAEHALELLRQSDWGIPFADWLEPRLDYLEMAQRLMRQARAVPRLPPPPEQPAPRIPPRPAPPRPPTPEIRLTPEVERWKQSLRSRSAPRKADQLVPGLKKEFEKQGLPPELVWLAEVESSFNPQARSPVGAAGLFQFMPATARQYGLEVSSDRDDRLEPQKSAQASAKYLKKLYSQFQSWPLALASYNAGEGRVSRLLAEANGTDFDSIANSLPIETRMYVPKVLATIALRENISPATLPPPRA